MYQSFYGFTEMPFNITPDPKFLYLSPTHQEALQHLKYGVLHKKGFIVLVGEVGCGKTTLCRCFLNELDPELFDTALILNPRINEKQMLKAILTELGELHQARSQVDLVAQINAPVLGLYGDADAGIPVDTVTKMEDALAAAGKKSKIILYPDAPHAFHADYRTSYRKEAAEAAWKELIAWFKANGVA